VRCMYVDVEDLPGTHHSRIIFRAFSIWSFGAGHWMEPSSSLIECVAWYSGMSDLAFFAGDLSPDGACLRFILGAFGIDCEARERI
jgi:hypothetical protein